MLKATKSGRSVRLPNNGAADRVLARRFYGSQNVRGKVGGKLPVAPGKGSWERPPDSWRGFSSWLNYMLKHGNQEHDIPVRGPWASVAALAKLSHSRPFVKIHDEVSSRMMLRTHDVESRFEVNPDDEPTQEAQVGIERWPHAVTGSRDVFRLVAVTEPSCRAIMVTHVFVENQFPRSFLNPSPSLSNTPDHPWW